MYFGLCPLGHVLSENAIPRFRAGNHTASSSVAYVFSCNTQRETSPAWSTALRAALTIGTATSLAGPVGCRGDFAITCVE